MDTSDPLIVFDKDGNCNHCESALNELGNRWHTDDSGEKMLDEIITHIRKTESGKEFDCVIGLSGGVDSSYLAYYAVNKGLRPLVVHVDCGWNSDQAVRNIENIVKKLNIELHTFVVNWEEMKDLQRSFFLAGLPDQDIPQDHAIFAALYNFANENNVRYVFNGLNFSTECIMPSNWGFQAMDWRHIRAVHSKYGKSRLKDYPHITFLERYLYYTIIRRMTIVNPLNYIDYRKDAAIELLKKELGWEYYGGKHHESRFTKFFQSYYLPVKFGIDKRRAHLSSLVISGQITRDEALIQIAEDSYNKEDIENDIEYVAKKLDWSTDEFKTILADKPHSHLEYPSNEKLFRLGLGLRDFIKGSRR